MRIALTREWDKQNRHEVASCDLSRSVFPDEDEILDEKRTSDGDDHPSPALELPEKGRWYVTGCRRHDNGIEGGMIG